LKLFGKAGCKLALADRDGKGLERTVGELGLSKDKVMSVQLDITDDQAVEKFVRSVPERFGRLDIALYVQLCQSP
jgi:NADP-dependent 3-hydroxy acid dehydrogenase YdfG